MALGTSKGKWMKIPNEGILAKDKTTKFKISQQMDGEKLMFKVTCSLYFVRQGLIYNNFSVVTILSFSNISTGKKL